MDSPQPICAHTDRPNGLSWPMGHPSLIPSITLDPELCRDPWPSTGSTSSQTYHSADSSLSYSTTNSASAWSSDTSFPYSVTSINSYKSRKNVLYRRRVHPVTLPAAASSEHFSISPDALIWQVRFLCTTLLPYAETRLLPAGRVLLQSLGLHGDLSQRVPVHNDEESRCCSELFIALTHEVLLKDAVSAGELEGPCELLHTTFNDILSKRGAFSSPKTPKSNEKGGKVPAAGALALQLQRSSNVLLALFSVLNTFEGALNTIKIKPAAAKDGALGDHYRMALLELPVSTGLTMEQYRKKLDQNLAQTQVQLNSFLGQPRGLLLPSTSVRPMILSRKGAPQVISPIEEGLEADGEGSSASGHTRNHSTQSRSDDGKHSLPLRTRMLRRLIPSSMGRKNV